MGRLSESIAAEGIHDTIKYVVHQGEKYIVDGHHRVAAARRLGLTDVPAEEVTLPYRGFKTIEDLTNWER